MELQLGLRRLPLNNARLYSRPFASFNPVVRGRLIAPYINRSPQRTLFGIRRRATATETATATAKSWGRICYRFTAYSSVFVVIAIAGFFIYDVRPHLFLCLVTEV